jgi:hypothetical protein
MQYYGQDTPHVAYMYFWFRLASVLRARCSLSTGAKHITHVAEPVRSAVCTLPLRLLTSLVPWCLSGASSASGGRVVRGAGGLLSTVYIQYLHSLSGLGLALRSVSLRHYCGLALALSRSR